MGNQKLISFKCPEAYIEGLIELVRAGIYPSRSEAIRIAIRDLLQKELWDVEAQRGVPMMKAFSTVMSSSNPNLKEESLKRASISEEIFTESVEGVTTSVTQFGLSVVGAIFKFQRILREAFDMVEFPTQEKRFPGFNPQRDLPDTTPTTTIDLGIPPNTLVSRLLQALENPHP